MTIFHGVKISLQVGLFTLFLVLFGIPSLQRYYAKSVLTKTEERTLLELEMPGVTVCPRLVRIYGMCCECECLKSTAFIIEKLRKL